MIFLHNCLTSSYTFHISVRVYKFLVKKTPIQLGWTRPRLKFAQLLGRMGTSYLQY